MRRIYFLILLLILIGTGIFFSCKKPEAPCEDCIGNKPPIAIAGPDQVIALPSDSISLDGSASNDPDGTITEFLWTKISGPDSFAIINAATAKTVVKDLSLGTYKFELKVRDNEGYSAKDTVEIGVYIGPLSNRPPVANAGADQTLTLPGNYVLLDGSASSDPDSNISNYSWNRVSGPSSSFIIYTVSSMQAQAQVVGIFVPGVYQFELKVRDAGGLSDKDTIKITVNGQPPQPPPPCDNSNRPTVTAQLIPVGTLSQSRAWITTASVGNKIFFAGGSLENWQYSSRVDIYDITSNTWSTAELCVGRYAIAATASGNRIFFAGGEIGDGTWPVDSVDIYDVSTNTWTVSHLSLAGNHIAAATIGDKVFFAGGDGGFADWDRHKRVDIFNTSTNTWSTVSLSEEKRGGHVAVAAGNKIYIAGGETMIMHGLTFWDYNWAASNVIDVYDNSTNTWTTSTMSEGKLAFAGIAVDDKIVWGGGSTGSFPSVYTSCNVEIRNINTGNSTVQQLFKPTSWWIDAGQNAVIKNNKIIFYRSYGNDRNKFDIYDIANNTWSIGVLSQPIPVNASITSVNNTIYIAGGSVNGVLSNQVWKLEF